MAGSLWIGALRDRLIAFFSVIRRNLISLIWLNLLFWGFCLAIVTIGPAVTGLAGMLRIYVTGRKPESVLGEFWDKLTANIAKSVAVSVVYAVAVFLTQYIVRLCFSGARGGQAWMYLPFVIGLLTLAFLIVTGFYLFLLLDMGRPLGKLLRDCVLLTVGYPRQNLIALALVSGITVLLARYPFLALGWYMLIGFSFMGLIIVSICHINIVSYYDPYAKRRQVLARKRSDAAAGTDNTGTAP